MQQRRRRPNERVPKSNDLSGTKNGVIGGGCGLGGVHLVVTVLWATIVYYS